MSSYYHHPQPPLIAIARTNLLCLRLNDKNLKEVKIAKKNGKHFDTFGAYLKTFQRDMHISKP